MAEEYDDIEEEMEQIEKESEDEEEVEKPKAKPAAKGKAGAPQAGGSKERYVAIHQPERIAIIDSVKEEVIADGFKDLGSAAVSARILNNQEKMLISLGA